MKIGIIGAGKIGTAMGNLAKNFSQISYVDVKTGYTNDYEILKNNDINFISVNTTSKNEYDMTNVLSCLKESKKNNLKTSVILSTCTPSFLSSEEFLNLSEEVIYSPLFIRQGKIEDDILNSEFVLIGGTNESCISLLCEFYKKLGEFKYKIMGFQEAGITKMGINGFLTMKIAYANMIGDYCLEEKINENIVLEAISSFKPINSKYFKYGYGYGGPCLPIDNLTLANEINKDFPLQVDKENESHLKFQLKHFLLNNHPNKKYTFKNVGYKSDLPIIINSQKLKLAEMLAKNGYDIEIKDTKKICDLIKEKYNDLFSYQYYK